MAGRVMGEIEKLEQQARVHRNLALFGRKRSYRGHSYELSRGLRGFSENDGERPGPAVPYPGRAASILGPRPLHVPSNLRNIIYRIRSTSLGLRHPKRPGEYEGGPRPGPPFSVADYNFVHVEGYSPPWHLRPSESAVPWLSALSQEARRSLHRAAFFCLARVLVSSHTDTHALSRRLMIGHA